ncbi:44238_t:CDS:2, partial [Gigaspora margarita]
SNDHGKNQDTGGKTSSITIQIKESAEKDDQIQDSKEITQTLKFKYFFTTNQPPQTFSNGDLVFISGKYIIENSEPCFTIAYSSIVCNDNINREFDMSNIPVTISYCMYFVTVNRGPKNVENFIYFGVKTVQYNSITSTSNVKMDMTIIYLLNSPRFKYLSHLGSNIKLCSNYFISGLFKFSKSGKIMIEATDIDYLRTSTINIAASESSYSKVSDTPSIIDIIDDDIDSTITKTPQNQYGLVEKLENSTNADVEADYAEDDNDSDNEKGTDLSCDEDLQDIEEQEES